jgi:hypothetical protein
MESWEMKKCGVGVGWLGTDQGQTSLPTQVEEGVGGGGGGLKARDYQAGIDTAALRQVLLIVYDLCTIADLASCSGYFLREQMGGFHDFLGQKPTPHFAGMELNINGLPNNVIHVSGFSGEDGGIAKLNAVSQVNTVFSYSSLVWMF